MRNLCLKELITSQNVPPMPNRIFSTSDKPLRVPLRDLRQRNVACQLIRMNAYGATGHERQLV